MASERGWGDCGVSTLLDSLDLKPETRKAYERMPAPCRAWALAKAAFEAAHERNFAQQDARSKVLTADDPEPEHWSALEWRPWYERNQARLDSDPVLCELRRQYPKDLRKLADAAEINMVNWASETLRRNLGARFASIEIMWTKYYANELYGDMREKFLQICFNCPEK